MSDFLQGKWIWLSQGQSEDSYAQFTSSFDFDGQGEAYVRLSCDSDYALYVNGQFVCSNQYHDYEHYKIYDDVDITPFVSNGENEVLFDVYYCGVSTSRYRPYKAGLIFEITSGSNVLCCSDERILSRKHPHYACGRKLFVTSQLGFTFHYDAVGENFDFTPSALVDKNCHFFARPIKRATLYPKKQPVSTKNIDDVDFIVDLGGECVGHPTLSFVSDCEQTISLSWGEILKDGHVRKTVGDRTFTFTYNAKIGENYFTERFLRLGCRYIEVTAQKPIKLSFASVIPQVYEVEALPVDIDDDLDRKIYEASVRTLKLCMMEHYVDCPWREQALYTCDSKNQMLCGYYAFKDGNADYARANLTLMGEDTRPDGLLSICFPCGIPLSIPSFSIHYLFAMRDYIDYTGDLSLSKKYFGKMTAIVDEMLKNRQNGVVYKFGGKDMWNFYEWTRFSDGTLWSAEKTRADLCINCLTVMAIDCLEYICEKTGEKFPYQGVSQQLRPIIRRAFYKNGAFTMHEGADEFTSLGNSLAILAKVATKDEARGICKKITSGEFVECSVSMKLMQYEALLSVDPDYKQFILSEIRKNYQIMLDFGHDTVWETMGGWQDFNDAGSLCHGWSAIPIYFFHKFGIARRI